ncbi:MAG: class II fructose-bisphosphatase [Candidatus Eremiobacteraeota bacterium]|nr:class II fructose-bisphosphatase [Candidatus Eremiobacteraeota bacterium]MBC5822838.1 class II fructose-bisphosphatase [Candidatus Eremiobacteraeota bacterium]
MSRRRIDARVELEFLRATEAAAIVSGKLVGRGDKNAVDQAAVDAMRGVLGEVDIDGVVVIGEGEKDEAPMLYIGEQIGTGDGPKMDVAVDPIDGTTLASKGGHGAISVVAAAERGSLFHTHIAYMDKIIVGKAARGVISIDASVEDNVRAVAKAMGRPVTEITVALLERPRNDDTVRRLRELGARVRLFGDGDIANGIIAALEERSRIDLLMGIGGATEGVVAACAVKCLGGDMQARLWLRDGEDVVAKREGLDPGAVLGLDDLCRSDLAMLAATGVTDGELLQGVSYVRGSAYTQSIIISSLTHTTRMVDGKHDLQSFANLSSVNGLTHARPQGAESPA